MRQAHKEEKAAKPTPPKSSNDIIISIIGNTLQIQSSHPLPTQQNLLVNALLMVTGKIAQDKLLERLKSDSGLVTPEGMPIINKDKIKEDKDVKQTTG